MVISFGQSSDRHVLIQTGGLLALHVRTQTRKRSLLERLMKRLELVSAPPDISRRMVRVPLLLLCVRLEFSISIVLT